MPLVIPIVQKSFKICSLLTKCPAIYLNVNRKLSDFTQECNQKKGIVFGYYDGENGDPCFTPAGQKFNDSVGGRLFDLVKESGSELGKGKSKTFTNLCKEYWCLALVGLGKDTMGYSDLETIDEGLEIVRIAAGTGAVKLSKHGCTKIYIEGLGHAEQAAEGGALGIWRFQENRSRDRWKIIPSLELFDDPDVEGWQAGLFKAEAQNLARRFSEMPPNQLTPLQFAQEIVNELCPCGIKVEVHDRDWIERRKMFGLLAVARGSCEPPVLVDISYCGGPTEQKPVLLVGKGLTFDSGGICLKNCADLPRYKGAVSGAAAAVAAIRACSALSIPINLNAVIPICENMPSGMAMKVGDIVRLTNGRSICIRDTDAEGRVVMADSIIYGQTAFKPKLVISLAALTDCVKIALGTAATGVFSNSEAMWAQTHKAGAISGDRVWRLPLWDYYSTQVTDFSTHDVDNVGRGFGGACLAAACLRQFVTCVDWLHFDTSGTGMLVDDKAIAYLAKGIMSGRPTRCLIQLLYQLACPEQRTTKC